MTPLRWLLLAAFAALTGCSEPTVIASDDGLEKLCTPNNYVFCLCSEGLRGTKRCSATGKSFGPCRNCEVGSITDGCTPGQEYPCDCDDGSEGLYTCLEDGASFDACRNCGQSQAGLVANECPGVTVTLAPGNQTTRSGSTEGLQDDFQPACSVASGPDAVYQVIPGGDGLLTAQVQGQGGFDPVLVSWGGACGGAAVACADSTGSGSVEEFSFQAKAGEPVFLGVDSSGGGGAFTLTLHLGGGNQGGNTCPGIPVALGPGSPAFFAGTTISTGADYKGALSCENTAGADVVYAVQPTTSGRMTARLLPQEGHDAALYVRETSCTSGPQIACSDQEAEGGEEELSTEVTAGKTYSVFVDGSTAGDYQLTLELEQSFCGDGKWTPPEQCDDGNNVGGDGCSAQCKVEQDPPSATCPGVGVFVAEEPLLLSGSTDAYGDFEKHPTCGGAGAPDRVYRVIPKKSGTLRARITSTSFDLVLYARKGACSGASAKNLGCDDKVLNGPEILLDLPVNKDEPVWLVVDGFKQGEEGVFALSLSVL
jgi:cysteine-rich repeat protein